MKKYLCVCLMFVAALISACGGEENSTHVASQESGLEAAPDVTTNASLPESEILTNEFGAFYGVFYVKGHPVKQDLPEQFCAENCRTFNGLYFAITEYSSPEAAEALKTINKESDQILLGCLSEQSTIEYYNQSNEHQLEFYKMSSDESKNILIATKEKPVALELTKLSLTGGSEAPTCYSDFYKVSTNIPQRQPKILDVQEP